MRIITYLLGLSLVLLPLPVRRVSAVFAPTISNINKPSICNNSVLVNFRTDVPTHAFIDYGTTTGYGSVTIDDSARYYREHAVQLTGLTGNTLYHFRVTVTGSSGTTQSSDQTVTTLNASTTCRELPSEVDTRMPDMTGAVEKRVCSTSPCSFGGTRDYTLAQFGTALSDAGTANEKRIITIEAGQTITGQYLMPANADQQQIVIRTSQYANLPEGKRVFPADVAKLVKIQNTNVDAPIIFAAASNHIRFIGIEATIDPAAIADAPGGAPQTSGMFYFLENVAGNSANLAKFITIDRCWVHGVVNKNTVRGIQISGEDIAVIDSYLNDFHSNGADTQAILGVAMKRVRILNCTLIASGEPFMWGGTGLGVSGYVVGGLEFLRNHIYYPRVWKENGPDYAGNEWVEKNLFEVKTSARMLMFGCYFGGTTDAQGGFWPDAQSIAVNLKLEQNSALGTCDLMEHLTLYKNFGKNLHAGIAVVGRQSGPGDPTGCTNKPERVLLRDNLFETDSTTWTPEAGCSSCGINSLGFAIGGVDALEITHNTMINATPTQVGECNSVSGDGIMLSIGDTPATKGNNFIFKDNIADYRGCGVDGGGQHGTDTISGLNANFNSWTLDHNGIMRTGGQPSNFPTGNVFATTYTGRFVNFNGGLDGNYRLAGSTTWDNAASDGTDIGADVDGAELASENTPTGNWAASATVITVCKWGSSPPCVSN